MKRKTGERKTGVVQGTNRDRGERFDPFAISRKIRREQPLCDQELRARASMLTDETSAGAHSQLQNGYAMRQLAKIVEVHAQERAASISRRLAFSLFRVGCAISIESFDSALESMASPTQRARQCPPSSHISQVALSALSASFRGDCGRADGIRERPVSCRLRRCRPHAVEIACPFAFS